MKIKYILLFIAAPLFYSCNQSDVGIFYGLENEVKITDNSLSNNLTIGSMAKSPAGELYIAAGRVYTKTSGSSEDWRKVSTPSGYDLSTSLAVNTTDSNIYAIFYDTDSADTALFKMPDGGSWTEVTDPVFEGSFEYVKSANGYILVSTRIDENSARLYYSNGGAFSEAAVVTMTGSDFYVIHDGTDFWVSNSNILYQGNNLNGLTDALTLDSTVEIKGLSESSGAYIYLSCWDRENRDGYLMATDGNNGTLDEESDDKKTYKLFNLTTFRAEGYDFLLCGTNGLGYRQILSPSSSNLDLDTPDDDVLSENYTSAIDLQNCAVIDFFVDGGEDGDLYALTATTGLWKNSLSGGTRVWSIE